MQTTNTIQDWESEKLNAHKEGVLNDVLKGVRETLQQRGHNTRLVKPHSYDANLLERFYTYLAGVRFADTAIQVAEPTPHQYHLHDYLTGLEQHARIILQRFTNVARVNGQAVPSKLISELPSRARLDPEYQELIERHERLRTLFDEFDSAGRQDPRPPAVIV